MLLSLFLLLLVVVVVVLMLLLLLGSPRSVAVMESAPAFRPSDGTRVRDPSLRLSAGPAEWAPRNPVPSVAVVVVVGGHCSCC